MEILNNVAKQFLSDVNADGKIDVADAVSSIQTLLSDASGKLDLNGMIEKVKNANLSEELTSWLGDGRNSPISAESINNLFESEKLKQFATTLNIDLEAAKAGLATAIPNLVDQLSSGGELVEKLTEGLNSLKAEVSQVADNAQAQAGGIFAKIKQLFS